MNALDKLAVDGADAASAPKSPASGAAVASRKLHLKEAPSKPSHAGGVVSAKAGAGGSAPAGVRKARKGDDDADTELVAAIIARLDRRGAQASQSTLAGLPKHDDPATADSLRKCEAMSDLVDARRCRNKVCEKRWGKTDGCPASRAPKSSTGAGTDHGKPGWSVSGTSGRV